MKYLLGKKLSYNSILGLVLYQFLNKASGKKKGPVLSLSARILY